MKASLFYRIAAVLLVLFALGHTVGFRNIDPQWHIDDLVRSMQSTHFDADGSNRTYWDFFMGFGLFVTALMLSTAVAIWQMAGLPVDMLSRMRLTAWGLAVTFGVVTWLSYRYFFWLPIVFSAAICVCLTLAAVSLARQK